MGFCWRSLVTFCRYWQKVTRRRHKKELLLAKSMSPEEKSEKDDGPPETKREATHQGEKTK